MASQPKNPTTQETFKGKWCRTNVQEHEILLIGSGRREALNPILDIRVQPTLTLKKDSGRNKGETKGRRNQVAAAERHWVVK